MHGRPHGGGGGGKSSRLPTPTKFRYMAVWDFATFSPYKGLFARLSSLWGGGGRGISGLAPPPLRKFLRAPMICNITCSSYITITPMIIIASINLFTCVSKLISLSLSLPF